MSADEGNDRLMAVAGNLLAGRYRLEELIGRGGFSEVWRATDAVMSRPVAVKLLDPGYAQQPEFLARFQAEARHAAVLWHENIAHIHDYDEPADGLQPYLVMELVDGQSLAGVLADGPLDAARTMDIVAQTAVGLQAAHAAGLIHRDIKPGNLLLSSSGTVKITDFGISHVIGSVSVTATGIVMGTAAYLAPERIAGAQAVPASDLYSLGIVAYECLAGTPPFVGKPLDVACAHRDLPVPPLLTPVSADVNALVMQLVAKDPAWRPGSAAEVARWAGRLRDDLRDGNGVAAGRRRHPLAAPAAVLPIAPAAFADDPRRRIAAVPVPASRARTGARGRRRRPVLVLASVAITGLIVLALTVTVGTASVHHAVSALPSAQPWHPTGGTVGAPPARPPYPGSPSRKAGPGTRPGPSSGDTGTVPVVVGYHRVTGFGSGRYRGHERIRRHWDGRDGDHGQGNGDGQGNGNANGHGHCGDNGNGQGSGNGNAQVLSIASQPSRQGAGGRQAAGNSAGTGGTLCGSWLPGSF